MKNLIGQARQTQALWMLWRNWVVGCGAPMFVTLMSLVFRPIWLSLMSLLLAGVLEVFIRRDRASYMPGCSLVLFIMMRVMLVSGIIMFLLALMFRLGLLEQWLGYINPRHPYIPTLVMAPTGFILTLYCVLRKRRLGFCRRCRVVMGEPVEQGFIGRLFRQEGHFQLKLLMWLSLALTVIAYLYYKFIYVNINLNSPDKLIFVWTPIIFYVVSLVYIATRYFTLWMYYGQEHQGGDIDFTASSRLRYIIVDKERIYLAPDEADMQDPESLPVMDTPAKYVFQHRDTLPLSDGRRYLRDLTRLDDIEVRFMYESRTTGGDSNVFHFIADVPDPAALEQSPLKGRWYTLRELDKLISQRRIAPMLGAELQRLHTITMAWKTYDRDGRRLYRIKHYKPSFHLRDITNPRIDYSDPHWFYVASNNEDRPFFRLRRFWDRMMNGVK